MHLGREASEDFARGVFTMTKLRALKLNEVTLDDGFFSVMSESAPRSQVDLTLLPPPPPPPTLSLFNPMRIKFMYKTANVGNSFGTYDWDWESLAWNKSMVSEFQNLLKPCELFDIEVDANHLHEFVCLLVYLFFCKDCGRTFNVIVKKYKIRIFNEIVTQTTQSLSINLHIYLQKIVHN